MPDSDSDRGSTSDWFTVSDPRQARILSTSSTFRYFEPFVARENTVSRAAAEVGCSVDTMLYRVRTFVDAGLLAVSRSERRAGRPIKHYRSVADAFFVPFAATPFATLEERLGQEMEHYKRRLVRTTAQLLRASGRDGRRIYRRRNGEVWNDAAADEGSPFTLDDEGIPAAYDFSTELQLAPDEARTLQRELHALFERYGSRGPGSGRPYLWQIVLVPALPE